MIGLFCSGGVGYFSGGEDLKTSLVTKGFHLVGVVSISTLHGGISFRYQSIGILCFSHLGAGLSTLFHFTSPLIDINRIVYIFPYVFTCLFIDLRAALPLGNRSLGFSTGNQSRSTFMIPSVLVNRALILLFQRANTVIDLTLLVVQLVFFSINDNHAMTNGSCKLILRSSLQSHVSNQIRNDTHLFLSVLHRLESASRFSTILQFWVKSFKPFQRRSRSNLNLAFTRVTGDYHNRIAIKISTRKSFRNLTVNTDGIFRCVTQNSASFSLLVIYSQDRNLKSSAMWITNQSYCFAILIIRGIHFTVFHRSDR